MSHKLPLADIKFLTEFHAYCLTRGDEAYDYLDNRNCAVCQFLRASGVTQTPWVGGSGWNPDGIPQDERNKLSCHREISFPPFTFSALATRLEALLVDAPRVS